MDVKLVLTGANEIDAVLRGLPLQINHRIVGAAIAEASKPLIERARELAPKLSGKLSTSISSIKTPLGTATSLGQVKVGPRLRKGGYKGHWIEYGTKVRRTKSGANRGKVTAHPFMKPAFDQTKDQILVGIETRIATKLLAFMNRTIKKASKI